MPFILIADIIITICVFVLFSAIAQNFFDENKVENKEKKSIVETFTMTVFFVGFYLVMKFHITDIPYSHPVLIMLGTVIVIFGTVFNICGRKNLEANWSNQIRIYKNHTLKTTGLFAIVRHPLYASLIWMFYGGCLVHPNYLAIILNTFVFIPAMFYRAKQEEKMLSKQFKEYKKYQKKVGMFFPKFF
jgi:protein-S-isoprenylcysteine O-methyltransferase Ste14